MVVTAVVVPAVFAAVFFVFFMFVFGWFRLVVPWPRHITATVMTVMMTAIAVIIIGSAIVRDCIMHSAVRTHYHISVFSCHAHENLRFGGGGQWCHSGDCHLNRQRDGDNLACFHSCFFFNNADFIPKVDTRRKFPSYGIMRRAYICCLKCHSIF